MELRVLRYFLAIVREEKVAVMRADSPLAAKEYVTADDLAGQKLIFPARKAVLDELERWLDDAYDEKNVISSNDIMNNAAAQVSLGWLLTKGTVPIVGATKLSHVESAAQAVGVKLSDEETAYLEEPYVPHKLVGVMSFNHE